MLTNVTVWLLYQFPEVIMLNVTGPRLFGFRARFKRVFWVSLIYSMLVPVFRLLLPGGWHTLAIVITFVPMIAWLYRISLLVALPPAMLSISLLFSGDAFIVPALLKALHISGPSALSNVATHIAVGYFSSSFLLIAFIASLAGFSFVHHPQHVKDEMLD